MNLKELTWPVRIYWDLPDQNTGTPLGEKIGEELIALKILFLSLRSPDADACAGILGKVKGGNMAVSLTLPGSALTAQLLASLPKTGVRTLLAEFSSFQDAAAWYERETISADKGKSPGLAFDVKRTNYHEIPDVVSLCLRRGIGDLVFPIQRLTGDDEAFCPTGEMRAGMAALLAGMDYRRLHITIHDPFLWQVFFPDAPYHEGGCQAANSMLYISPEYKVHPCPAMPLELGDLHDTAFRQIIRSGRKKDLRRLLKEPAGDCAGCDLAENCLGGCRGRALAMTASLDHRDPACGL